MDNAGPNGRHQHSAEDVEYRRVEVITGRRRRRDWSLDKQAGNSCSVRGAGLEDCEGGAPLWGQPGLALDLASPGDE